MGGGEVARYDGSHREHIHVDEVVLRAARKVFVCDVAASHAGEHAIGDEELVMRPVIQSSEIDELWCRSATGVGR